jgi:hypothetical protein
MAGSSSLLRSAASRRAAIQNEKNRIADMEWGLSAKTADDLAIYNLHYNDASLRANSSDKISIQNKITTATRAFRTGEIQRSSIDVLEGTSTNYSKQDLLIGFYKEAVANGDMNQAQSLRLQIDNLQNTIISEQKAQMNLATQAFNNGYTDAKAYVSDLLNGSASPFSDPRITIDNLNNDFRTSGTQLAITIKDVSDKYGLKNIASYDDLMLNIATNTISSIKTLRDSYPAGTNEYAELDNKYITASTQPVFAYPGKNGQDLKMSFSDIKDTVDSAQTGHTGRFSIAFDKMGKPYMLENQISQWETSIDANGNPQILPKWVNENVQSRQDANLANRYGMINMTGLSNLAKGGADYTMVSADIGKGTKSYALKNGELFEVNPQGVIEGKSVAKMTDPNVQNLEQQYLSPVEALRQLSAQGNTGYRVNDTGQLLVDTQAGTITVPDWQVDERGNVSFVDSTVGQVYTIDTSNGAMHTASGDAKLTALENNRIQALAQTGQDSTGAFAKSQQLIQPSDGGSSMLMGADQLRNQLANQRTTSLAQQASTQSQLNTLPSTPLRVAPIPQPTTPLAVQQVPQPTSPLKVAPISQPSKPLSVYQAPITATAGQKPLGVTTTPQQNVSVDKKYLTIPGLSF